MADPHSPDWIGAALGAAATAFVGTLAWLGVRTQAKAPKADPQAVQNAGWAGLLERVSKELDDALEDRAQAAKDREHLNRVLEEERRTWRIEREAWRIEREALMGEIAQLQAVAHGFENLLRRNGINLPERKVYTAKTVEVVETTLRQDAPPASDD